MSASRTASQSGSMVPVPKKIHQTTTYRRRSYHLFFVCPDGAAFTYACEIESLAEPGSEDDWNEDEMPLETVAGGGRTGWSVAVSLLAPFAVVTLSDMDTFEDGTTSEPSLESNGFTETGQPTDEEV
jgi:hypothetical protein